jgi:hypothetical protein
MGYILGNASYNIDIHIGKIIIQNLWYVNLLHL